MFNRHNRKLPIKKRIKLVQHHYNEMTNAALNPTLTYDEMQLQITHHALMAEKYQTELFYPND